MDKAELKEILHYLQVKSIDNYVIATRNGDITKPLNISTPEELLEQVLKRIGGC